MTDPRQCRITNILDPADEGGHDWQPTEVQFVDICTRCHTTRRDDGITRRSYQPPPGYVQKGDLEDLDS